jgi:uncharacterized DUF497 family protein
MIQRSANGLCANVVLISNAKDVFAGLTIDIPDLRRDYGERRINSIGHLNGRDPARRGVAHHIDEESQ